MKIKWLVVALAVVGLSFNAKFLLAQTEVKNKICPIEGEEIGSMKDEEPATVEHDGKIYNLCSAHCIEAFQENPEKFSKMADKEMASENHEGHDHPEHDNEEHHNH